MTDLTTVADGRHCGQISILPKDDPKNNSWGASRHEGFVASPIRIRCISPNRISSAVQAWSLGLRGNSCAAN